MIHLSIDKGESLQSKANSIANNLPEFGNPTASIFVLPPTTHYNEMILAISEENL